MIDSYMCEFMWRRRDELDVLVATFSQLFWLILLFCGRQFNACAYDDQDVIQLKAKATDLKVLLVLNAGQCKNIHFYSASRRKRFRREFIARIINYLRKHKFDGLDLRCVFIEKEITPPEVKQALSDLVHDLRLAIDLEKTDSDKLLLSLVVFGERAIDKSCYDVVSLTKDVDWINLWAFDLHGDWYNTTGHHSNLYVGPKAEIASKNFSVDTLVQFWLGTGAPKQKLVLALPSFARSYTLTSSQTDEGAPATIGGKGPYSRLRGRLAYYEVCELLQTNGTVVRPLKGQHVSYLVSGKKWVGYDDPISIEKKIIFLTKRRLGGFALVWVDTDDFTGNSCKKGTYPLLKAAVDVCDDQA